MNYDEYTTVNNVRSVLLDSAQSKDDGLILSIIRDVSREMHGLSNLYFWPRIQTHLFDVPDKGYSLYLDEPLLEATSFLNGDGSTIDPTDYVLYPLNKTPKNEARLIPAYVQFQIPSSGYGYGAMTVSGVWGYHPDYSNAWQEVTTLSAAITSTSSGSASVPTGIIYAGELLKIDSEYLYVSAVTSGSVADTLSILRGVNGSTAATHLTAATVSRWTLPYEVEMIARFCTAGYYRLRSNPMMDTVSLDGVVFTTPKDVQAYMRKRMEAAGLIRLGFA